MDDIIIRTKNNLLFYDGDRQTFKFLFQVTTGINLNMRRQLVAPFARQVVDEGNVAKFVVPPPIQTVCFEWIPPVGAE